VLAERRRHPAPHRPFTVDTDWNICAFYLGNPETRVGVRQHAEGVDPLVGVNLVGRVDE